MRNVKSATGLCLILAMLSGCVHFAPKPIAPAETASRYERRSLDDPGLHDYLQHYLPADKISSWPIPAWDSESLALAALFFRPDMELVHARWAAATAATVTARQLQNPVLGFAPQYNTTGSNLSPWILPVSLDFPFETAGKRSARTRQADYLSQSAEYEITGTAWRLRLEVQQALLALQSARESVRIIEEQLRVHQELVKRMQVQLDAGEISSFERAQSQTALRTLQLARLARERQGKVAEVQLAAAVGVSAETIQTADLRFMPLDQDLPEIELPEARQHALVNRTDILAALAEYEAAQEKLQLEIAGQYPDFNLGPGYEFDQDDNKWGLALSITLPVLNHNEGPIAEAEARRMEAAAKFNILQFRVLGEIDSAVVTFRSQTETVVATEKVLSISRRQAQRAQLRKEVGELSRLDELNTQAVLLKVQQDLLQARVRQHESFHALANALQSPGSLPGPYTRPQPDHS